MMGLLGAGCVFGADLKVVSLHPLVGDALRRIGGEFVEVVDMIGPNGDPHTFEPGPAEIGSAEGATIYFVSGMGLEGYLPKLAGILAGRAEIVEVGASLPALEGKCDHGHDHHHDHDHEVDPHWWHSVDLFRRGSGVIAEELVKALPERKAELEANAAVYRKELDELERWVRRELVKVPRERRHLATAHEAFQYFCEAYGFEGYAVQGLNREQMPGAAQLAKLISTLKEKQVVAIFSERESNPKILESLTRDSGISLGGELIADGRGVSRYEEMMRSNVETIVKALGE